ncbi:MAG: hypothetical protein QOJ03_2021 [Frankiaceae bacterium]|jgi:hypothetical protein|nr:hypothetical protein [Frankiaceae bacterium]
MTGNACCGRETRDITISLKTSTLTLVHCDRCDGHQWSRDGKAITLGSMTDSVAREWNRKRFGVSGQPLR